MADDLEGSLKNVIDQHTLKWIFVGGKGGVGKTTCSSSLAIQLAKVRKNVLIISTDPAHNISDAFNQKFSKDPQKVNGFDNLYAMEIDTKAANMPAIPGLGNILPESGAANLSKEFQGIVSGLPGIDEAVSFSEMIRLIDSMDFDCVVFDTAPTGHTLRLLQFPTILNQLFEKLNALRSTLGPMLGSLMGMLGMGQANPEEALNKMTETVTLVQKVVTQFKDPNVTTFVCVCIAEFLSLYETERLIQELTKQGIDTHNIVVNQLLFPDKDENGCVSCKKCQSRFNIQKKYLEQMYDLYEDFHLTKLPLLEHEVRGPEMLKQFSENLYKPYTPPQ